MPERFRWLSRRAPLFILLAAVLAALPGLSCSPAARQVESLTIATAPLESSALVYIAQDQGFFARNSINATVKTYETGAAAHAELLKGEADIAIPAEYPLVGSAFKKEPVSVFASIDKAEYFFLVGRKDRGLGGISDLKGKKIGVVQKTIAEFYLGRFLTLNGLDANHVTLVNMNYTESHDAIVNGSVDAVVSRPPHLNQIVEQLGANAVVWRVQSSQALYAILTARNDWINGHPGLLTRLLKSLAAAEEYAIKRPDQARAIIQKRLGFDDAYMADVWEQNQFFLSLDQSLITTMEDEARWMISNNLTSEKAVPNFLDYVYEDGIKAVNPGAVNIIR